MMKRSMMDNYVMYYLTMNITKNGRDPQNLAAYLSFARKINDISDSIPNYFVMTVAFDSL